MPQFVVIRYRIGPKSNFSVTLIQVNFGWSNEFESRSVEFNHESTTLCFDSNYLDDEEIETLDRIEKIQEYSKLIVDAKSVLERHAEKINKIFEANKVK